MTSANMEIPHSQLSDEALGHYRRVHLERRFRVRIVRVFLEEKVSHVIKQLERGEVVVTFDAVSETCNLMPSR